MELTLRTIFWTVQILGFLMPPLLLFVSIGAKASRRKRAAMLAALLLVVELCTAFVMTLHPPIVDFSSSEVLTAEEKHTVRAVASGIYSTNIPIFPWLVVITEHTDSVIRWRTHYAFWGTTEHIYSDTYECTKPLTGW